MQQLILPVIVTLALLLQDATARAQSNTPKLELGAHFSALRLSEHEGADVGVGGRATYNFNDYLALEGEFNFFPRELRRVLRDCNIEQTTCLKAPTIPVFTDRRIQGLFGVKAGVRYERVGFFGKLRPGFMSFHNQVEVVCITQPCPPLSSAQTEFVLDAGGVIEFYPARRWMVRFDLGDTWVRGTGNDGVRFARELGHNFQVNAGIGMRF